MINVISRREGKGNVGDGRPALATIRHIFISGEVLDFGNAADVFLGDGGEPQ